MLECFGGLGIFCDSHTQCSRGVIVPVETVASVSKHLRQNNACSHQELFLLSPKSSLN